MHKNVNLTFLVPDEYCKV